MGHPPAVALEWAAISVDIFRVGAGSERVFAVPSLHRANGEIQLAQVEIGDGAAHASSLTLSASDSGLDVAMRFVGWHEDFVGVVLAKR